MTTFSDYARAGLSVMPVRLDGSKAPALALWKDLQESIASDARLARWQRERKGIGIIGGPVSGNLEIIDIDDASLFRHFRAEVERLAPGLIDKLPIIKTPDGWHIYTRTPLVEGNQKLAIKQDGVGDKTGKAKFRTLIETRAKGGMVVAPGSPPSCHPTGRLYEHKSGPPIVDTPVITDDERDVLFRVARSFNEVIDEPEVHKSNGKPRTGLARGDDFNQRASWTDILTPHDWTEDHQRGEKTYWRRPGKEGEGWSATTGLTSGAGNELLCVFSMNAEPFPGPTGSKPCSSHSKFDTYARLNHGGDYSDAAKALVKQGYGDRPKRNTTKMSSNDSSGSVHPLTDYGNAERFAEQNGSDVRYVHEWGEWLIWDSTRWARDKTGEVVRRAKATIRSIYGEALAADEKDVRKRIADWGKASEAAPRIEALLKLAKSERPIPIGVDELDADPWLLNCKSGTINLRKGTLREHRREDFITRMAPVQFTCEPGDDPELWLGFLNLIFADNQQLIGFIQRFIGSALVGQVFDHVLAILHGSGQNGKSTLLEAITNMLGDNYAMVASPDLLMPKRGERHPTELADLCGKRFVAAEETEDNCRLAESLAKHLTGGTKIRARHVHQDSFQFTPSHTLALATNHRPIIRGVDLGIWRRIRLIPFAVQIPDDQVDKGFGEKLKIEYPAILRWAVSGCLLWQRHGLGEPVEVQTATDQYRADSDAIGQFIEDRCQRQGEVQASLLYKAFRAWADEAGEYAGSQTWFGNKLTELGFEKVKKNRVFYQGIDLRETTG